MDQDIHEIARTIAKAIDGRTQDETIKAILMALVAVDRPDILVDPKTIQFATPFSKPKKPEGIQMFPNPFVGCTRETESPNKQAK